MSVVIPEVSCPICGAMGARLVYADRQLTVVRCPTCSVVYQPQGPGFEAELAEYYRGRPTAHTLAWNGSMRKLGDVIDKIVSSYPGGKLLDVGCGSGEFLHSIGQHSISAVGVEPNEAQAEYARSKGLEVITGSVQHLQFPPASFDVVTLFQVLEHLSDPVGGLIALRTYLRPGGLLVVDVPSYNNPRFLAYRATGLRALVRKDFIRPHVFYYTPKTLTDIIRRAGYRVGEVRCGRYSQKFAGLPLGGLLDWATDRLKIGGIVVYAHPA